MDESKTAKKWDDRMDGLMDWCEQAMRTHHANEKGGEAARILLEALKVQPKRSDRLGHDKDNPDFGGSGWG